MGTNYFIIISTKKSEITAVIKVLEILASSPNSWEEAKKWFSKASKTIKGFKSAYVQELSIAVKDRADSLSFKLKLNSIYDYKKQNRFMHCIRRFSNE